LSKAGNGIVTASTLKPFFQTVKNASSPEIYLTEGSCKNPHLGLHGLADKYFDGDIDAAQRRLRQNEIAGQDPAPWNGAFPKYRRVTE
jgi:hypothetical protein